MRPTVLYGATLLALSAPTAWAAQTTAGMLGPSEVMVSICAGLQNGNGIGPGGLVGMIDGRSDCQSDTTPLPGAVVSRSVAYDELPAAEIQAKAYGQAQMGQLQLGSWMKGDNVYGLSAGVANAGWNDTLTITPVDPGLLGRTAYLEFQVHVGGALSVTNTANAFTGLSLAALRDDGFFGGAWATQASGVFGGLPTSRTVDEVATLWVAAPLGIPFELGLFGVAWSSGGSSFPGPNQATNDFTVTWAGISALSINGAPVAYSLSSQSGIDWQQGFTTPVPEPATALTMLAGLAVLIARRRQR